jgi:hypothetical protein
MRIAYCTTDEVNRHLAVEMAAACGLTLCPLDPKDAPPIEAFDAVLVDGDFWLSGEQREVLAEPLAGNGNSVVAVHGYNLADDQAEALRQQGVEVSRRLRPRLFRLLRRAIRARCAARVLSHKPQGTYAISLRGGMS